MTLSITTVVMRASEMLITEGRDGGVQNHKSCLLRKTGRYPHLSNATEEHRSGPPRAGRKGIRIQVCVGSLCHHTCCGRKKHKSYFTCHFRNRIHLRFFFPVPGPILINSFVEIRYCMTCVVVFSARTETLILGTGLTSCLSVCQVF
jgi:hypothetical protein